MKKILPYFIGAILILLVLWAGYSLGKSGEKLPNEAINTILQGQKQALDSLTEIKNEMLVMQIIFDLSLLDIEKQMHIRDSLLAERLKRWTKQNQEIDRLDSVLLHNAKNIKELKKVGKEMPF